MQKKIVLSITVVVLLLVGVMATSVLATNTTLVNNPIVSKKPLSTKEPIIEASIASKKEQNAVSIRDFESENVLKSADSSVSAVNEEMNDCNEVDIESLCNAVPSTFDETEAQLSTQRIRFLLYTHDGKNIMWGFVGKGYFIGNDNNGKRCWGIYGNNVFAGFYDGKFFWGRYRSGNWKAEGLFELDYSSGKYILFPSITTLTTEP
jgi:hypothetical protein